MYSIQFHVRHLPTPPSSSSSYPRRRHNVAKFHTVAGIPMVSSSWKKSNQIKSSRNRLFPFNAVGDPNSLELSDSQRSNSEHEADEASGGKDANHQGESQSSDGTLKKLTKYGIAGILSYGLLNTAYYLSTFIFVWFYVAPAPGKMGYMAAIERFLKLMATVWAGSQVTKLLRASGALALAPVVAKGLSWFTNKFNFESQGKAFIAIVGCCFGLAFVLFLVVTLLSA